MAKFYGVKRGREIGVFTSWEECKASVDGFSKAAFKSFNSYRDAYFFVHDRYPEGEDGGDLVDIGSQAEMVAYIDGSYDDSIKRFGYAGIIFHKGERVEFAHSEANPELLNLRNVAGELKAAMYAMDYARKKGVSTLHIYYDYTGIENWAIGAWKTNRELTREYAAYAQEIMKTIQVKFIKVRAHTGDKYNEEVDKLAKRSLTDESCFRD